MMGSPRLASNHTPRVVRVNRPSIPREVLQAVARPEFQAAIVELLKGLEGQTIVNTEGPWSGRLFFEAAADESEQDRLHLAKQDGVEPRILNRAFLIEFLRAHEQWIGTQEAIENDRYNPELAEKILDIVMEEEDRIRAEMNVGIIVEAYTKMKQRARRWMIAAGFAATTAVGGMGVAMNYAGEEVANDVGAWTENAGEEVEDAWGELKREVKSWFKEDPRPKKKKKAKKE